MGKAKRVRALRKHPKPKGSPDWNMAFYVYKGTPDTSSYNHTNPGAYRRKCDRNLVSVVLDY